MKELNLRSKHWQFVAYPDPADGDAPNNHFLIDEIIANLTTSGARVAYILHDCDTDAKPHYHFVCEWQRAIYMSTLQSITGHTSRNAFLLFDKSELRYKMRYLTHKDNLEKADYPDANVNLIGWGVLDYDMIVSSVPFLELSNDDKAQRMCDLCLAYVSHQLTMEECIAHLPAIAFNVRNFLTLADALRKERADCEYNDAMSVKCETAGLADEWRRYIGVWQDWHKQ